MRAGLGYDEIRTVDAALQVDRPTALALMDSALHRGLLTPAGLSASIDQARHRRGIVAVRRLAELADARAESQVESRVRLACIDGDVPPDDLQYVVRDPDGHVLAIGDLAWVAVRRRPLIGEADGESVHALPGAVYRDRTRGNALVAQACDTVRFTYADTFARLHRVRRQSCTAGGLDLDDHEPAVTTRRGMWRFAHDHRGEVGRVSNQPRGFAVSMVSICSSVTPRSRSAGSTSFVMCR
jgi:hypothetical protein